MMMFAELRELLRSGSNSQASVGLRKHEMRSNPCIIGGKIPFAPSIIMTDKG